jgi:very-short-patch-repair endonuclease
LTCDNCGQEFETWKSQIEHRGRRFCSRRCYQLYEGESSIETPIRIELERRGEEFLQEAEIGPYQVDFLLPRRMKVIECDGSDWHSLAENILRDRRKSTFLRNLGYQVFRLSEKDILSSPEDCIDIVLGG